MGAHSPRPILRLYPNEKENTNSPWPILRLYARPMAVTFDYTFVIDGPNEAHSVLELDF